MRSEAGDVFPWLLPNEGEMPLLLLNDVRATRMAFVTSSTALSWGVPLRTAMRSG